MSETNVTLIFNYINKFNNMLGSHNSFTYLKAVNKPIFNKFTKYWRCQYKSIQEQYDAGVRFFDIRVATESVKVGSKNKIMWRSCHGACNLDNIFTTLSVACKQFKDLGPDVKIRILLEKGNTNDIAFTIDKGDLDKTLKIVEKVKSELDFSNVFVDDKIAKVSIVGAGMIDRPGIAATMFKTLADLGINIKMISTSEIKISCIVAEDDAKKAVVGLHKIFHLDCDEIADVKGDLPDLN